MSRAEADSGRAASARSGKGLAIADLFCPAGLRDPFESTDWQRRTVTLTGEGGDVLFVQADVEVPASWSQRACDVVVSQYFYGECGTAAREQSMRQLIRRVTRTIADWGREDGYFATAGDAERFYRELTWLCLHQYASFNSPVWFHTGVAQQYGVAGSPGNWHYDRSTGQVLQSDGPGGFPQASACFIQSVRDTMEDIMALASSEARLFKSGGGTGTDLSTLRSRREKLTGGGTPSGPLSFMRVFDQVAAVVKSGGKTRRAAKMQSLSVSHPDILEFIECKWREELKARVLIERGGYGAGIDGEAYCSVLFQNTNLSVRVPDEFMQAVEAGRVWTTRWVTDPRQCGPAYPARFLLQRIAECAWECGDPGMQFDTTINRWHTCPHSGRIHASNPCSEYMFLDDTACNLASLNLIKFLRPDGQFDVARFAAACRLLIIAQEILVDRASYPTRRVAEQSHLFRPLGLGYANLGALLMSAGLPYDSEAARGLCGSITALLHASASLASSELAESSGPFPGYEANREAMLGVMHRHRAAVEQMPSAAPSALRQAARSQWDEVLSRGERFGFRNAQVTVLAPTGTISFMMDCDTTGIEPEIALVKRKRLAGGGTMTIVNRSVARSLQTLGYDRTAVDALLRHVEEYGTLEGAPQLSPAHLPVFDCALRPRRGARSIPWRGHLHMMAAAQPFLSGGISKTVNLPAETSSDEVREAFMEAWRLGLKALSIYRDGSKRSQPLSSVAGAEGAAAVDPDDV
jgi:ribonucleoside-diphosphate reductase alpha chain